MVQLLNDFSHHASQPVGNLAALLKWDGIVPTKSHALFVFFSTQVKFVVFSCHIHQRHKPSMSQAGALAEICLSNSKRGVYMAFCSPALSVQKTLSNPTEPFVMNVSILLSNTGLKHQRNNRDSAMLSYKNCLLCPTVPQVWPAWDKNPFAFAFIF